jgi:3'-phosphoadenosine 5'-phosphosulfate sulfotransferase (PAPS reductase)/FAD synthetase
VVVAEVAVVDEQLSILPGANPDELVARAHADYKVIARYCLFSGGNDSSVLAHRCREHYDALCFIDTGTAVPGVIEHVRAYADWIGKPLKVYESGRTFPELVLGDDVWWRRHAVASHEAGRVLGIEEMRDRDKAAFGQSAGFVKDYGIQLGEYPHGFPSPAAHGRAYNRLKERRIRDMVREAKAECGGGRDDHVLLLSGKRRAESKRRGRTTKGIETEGGQLYVNPLIDWGTPDMLRYRREHELPESDVAALLHRSGECNCGAFAEAAEERALMAQLWPEWWSRMEALETRAEELGIRWCRWGGYDAQGVRANEASEEKAGNLCSSCEFRLFEMDATAEVLTL